MGAAPPTMPESRTSLWWCRSTTATRPRRWMPSLPPSSSSAAPGNHDGNPWSGFVKKGHTCMYAGDTITRGPSGCCCSPTFCFVFVCVCFRLGFLFITVCVTLFLCYCLHFFVCFCFSFCLPGRRDQPCAAAPGEAPGGRGYGGSAPNHAGVLHKSLVVPVKNSDQA